ncbi:MAG: 2-hydroxychromene-2-carboxylate isomerase [Pseudomonadota bacterium]
MHSNIDYYFTSVSPFVYLGHDAIVAVASKHNVQLNPKPVNLGGVWQESGSVPLGQRSPIRQRYRLVEMERIAEWRGLPINLTPAHFPTNPTLADLCVVALTTQQQDALPVMADFFRAVWVEERDIADTTVLEDILTKHGHHADAIMAMANSDACSDVRQANTEAAIAADATGVPSYVVGGEVFWGQDRIELVDHMITTARSAIIPSK